MIRQALDQLKHQIPLLDYLQGHHWQSTGRLSRGRWMGLCPLHQDHKPSFVVDTSKNLFYCYGSALCMKITNRVSWWIPTKISSTATAVAAAAM